MSEGKKEILLGDCLELMKDIPNGSIDMILCDLPYGTTKNKWDSVLPLDKLWAEYERIITNNGAIVLFAQTPFDKVLGASKIDLLKYEYVWNKKRPTGHLNSKFAPMKQHENILVFSKASASFVKDKAKAMCFNPQYSKGKPYTIFRANKSSSCYDLKHQKKNIETVNDGFRYPISILEFAPETGLHPTQKPLELMEYLVKTYTNEGELVLDNTAGSGTTAIACLNTKRQFIVMEKEQKYYDIILKRVADFNKKFETQTLFGNEM
jgi:site-specific DNA-methyltransferase (adenine-specific)